MKAKHKKAKIRKATKYIYIIIAIMLILISSYDLLKKTSTKENVGTKTEQVYTYTNNFSYDYNVNLIENKYIKDEDLTDKKIVYITDLIDNIDLNLKYNYNADKKENLSYEYEVIGKIQAVYTKNGDEQKVIDKDETLVKKKIETQNSDNVSILENITLDLKDKNELISELKQKMGINVTAEYDVILNVTVKTNVQGNEINDSYKSIVKIDLAEKVTDVSGDNNKSDTEYIAAEVKETKENSYTIIFDIIGIIIALFILRYVSKAKVVNTIKNEYKHELNKILKLCQDRIVMINSKPEVSEENITLVKDFGEIVKLSEELFKPILCFIDEKNEETWFNVVSNNVNYRYILRK